MLRIHFSNRIERLADELAGALMASPPPDPLVAETILVGHAGMDEWLKRALAERLGVAANFEFQQPGAFVWRMLRARDPALPRSSPLDRGPLVWRLYAALIDNPAAQAPAVRRYLEAGDERAPFELAETLATVFEQYQIYRPEWIRDWEAGHEKPAGAEWQAGLWRRIATGATPNPACLYADFARDAEALNPANDLPPRLFVFGLSALAPVYLELLAALARTRDVSLFVPDPSRAYWGDIEPENRLARWQLLRPERAEYATTGHPLLSALGIQTRDFIELLHGLDVDSESHEHFEKPPDDTLLARLQADMLDLVEQPESHPLAAADDSLRVHVCHSRRREIEVLHDSLLARFEADPGLGPEDILVMAPNIDDYAEHIGAVFGAAPEGRYIPWSLADRSARAEHPIPEAMMTLLELPESRFKVSEVIGLLEIPALARRHGLDAPALADLRRWVEAVGVRWGLDAEQREALALPAEEAFTWRFGLDRLLAGYALAPDDDALWDGLAPWGEFEGQAARSLGALAAFIDELAHWREALAEPRPLAGWAEAFHGLLRLFQPESAEDMAALELLADAVHDLAEQGERAEFDADVPGRVARAAMAARLAVPRHPRPFLSGRVTFCALAPMRSIPAKLVWLLGMSEADFPRRGRPPGFDLIAAHPRRGDRARRTEDRALFLEALQAARDSFQLSYVGRGERDDGELPPSVVVSELLGVLGRMGADEARIIEAHPLQPFSARYRAEPRRGASYAAEWLGPHDAEALPEPFAPTLPITRDVDRIVTLDELARGLANPARAFKQALGIAPRSQALLLADEEPFTLKGLGAWKVRNALLARWLEHGEACDPVAARPEFVARGWLPMGEAGRLAFDDAVAETARLVQSVRETAGSGTPREHEIDLALDGWRLHGRIANVYPQAGLIFARAGGLRAKYRLAAWLQHLALGASETPVATHCIGLDKGTIQRVYWQPVAAPRETLLRLCALYERTQSEALPLLPELSLQFARQRPEKGETAAYRTIEKVWESDYGRVDGEEDYADVMRGSEPFDDTFGALAQALFDPMLAAEIAP